MSEREWMKFYYATPEPERLADEVRRWQAEGTFKRPEAPVIAAFLGKVMAANPGRTAAWLEELHDVEPETLYALHMAAWLSAVPEGHACIPAERRRGEFAGSPPDLLQLKIDEPVVLDVLWACYFATGDARAVRRVVSVLDRLSEYGAASRFEESAQTEEDRRRALDDAMFQAASWSLRALMAEHRPLKEACERMLEAADLSPNERLALALALEQVDPDHWGVQVDPAGGTARIIRR